MRYKGKQGNSYLFECDGEELELTEDSEGVAFIYKDVWIDRGLDVQTLEDSLKYKDIQTAVSMMKILIEEGVV